MSMDVDQMKKTYRSKLELTPSRPIHVVAGAGAIAGAVANGVMVRVLGVFRECQFGVLLR